MTRAERIVAARIQGVAARHSAACRTELHTERHGDAVKAAVEEILAAIAEDEIEGDRAQLVLDEAAAANINDHHEPYQLRHQILVAAGANPEQALAIKQARGHGWTTPQAEPAVRRHEPGS